MTSLTQAQIAKFQGIAGNAPSISPSDPKSLLKATASLLDEDDLQSIARADYGNDTHAGITFDQGRHSRPKTSPKAQASPTIPPTFNDLLTKR